MKSVLIRTGSDPVHVTPVQFSSATSHRISFSDHGSLTDILFPGKNNSASGSPRGSLHLEVRKKKKHVSIRRALSESNIVRSGSMFSGVGSRSFPTIIPEEVEEDEVVSIFGSMILANKCLNRELGSDNGMGTGQGRRDSGGRGGGGAGNNNNGGGGADQSKMGAYYMKMLKADPVNALLLRNYGKFLHEVERDMVRAEECYERAILACPGDGEVLALYGKLIWESCRNGERAKTYFGRAIQASPEDCFVLGSYANFLWESEEEDEEKESLVVKIALTSSAALLKVF
ncbi:hypothetical protein GIB67_002019 [Kingdonia uniflora]|uniref:Uncharacterized protein n=1 Tax=Kingdonia uniflora TaxID=39325 RepID=A0A7J7MA15_9MAGN|nr:hypothetical protein GIB67_002019 [Kingdonia uniflora]